MALTRLQLTNAMKSAINKRAAAKILKHTKDQILVSYYTTYSLFLLISQTPKSRDVVAVAVGSRLF